MENINKNFKIENLPVDYLKELEEQFKNVDLTKIVKTHQAYIVDITKPPAGPPHRMIKEGSDKLTKTSREQHRKYQEYIEKYKKELNESRKRIQR